MEPTVNFSLQSRPVSVYNWHCLIVKLENIFTVRQATKTHHRWRGLYPRPSLMDK